MSSTRLGDRVGLEDDGRPARADPAREGPHPGAVGVGGARSAGRVAAAVAAGHVVGDQQGGAAWPWRPLGRLAHPRGDRRRCRRTRPRSGASPAACIAAASRSRPSERQRAACSAARALGVDVETPGRRAGSRCCAAISAPASAPWRARRRSSDEQPTRPASTGASATIKTALRRLARTAHTRSSIDSAGQPGGQSTPTCCPALHSNWRELLDARPGPLYQSGEQFLFGAAETLPAAGGRRASIPDLWPPIHPA